MKGLLFTYALTYGGAAVSLYRPFYGLLIYIAFAILRPESLWHWSVPAGNYSRIVAVALLIGWVLNGMGNWKMGGGRSVTLCFACFCGWAVLSTLTTAVLPDQGFAFVVKMSKIFLPFLVGITLIENMDQVRQIAWVLALSVSYIALELNIQYYGGFNRLHVMGFGGMDNNCLAIQLVSAVGFMFFFGFAATTWWQRLAAGAALVVLINAVMFSFSRGGVLSLIVTAGVGFLLIPKRPVHFLVMACAVLIGLRLAGREVVDRFRTAFVESSALDTAAQSRLDLWGDCWSLMLRSPFLGVGPDHFPHYAHVEFGWPVGKEAHSLWLQTGAELGFVGLGFLTLFYVLCIARIWPLTRETNSLASPLVRDTARMVIASLSGFIVASQFVSLEGLEFPYYVVLMGAGVLKVVSLESATVELGRLDSVNSEVCPALAH